MRTVALAPRIHVPGLLPGERAYVQVVHVSPHVGYSEKPELTSVQHSAIATLLRRDSAAPERQIPACGAFGQCGGCTLQHLSYAAQLQFKRALLCDQLAAVLTPRGGAMPAAAGAAVNIEVAPCVPSPQPLHYRSRVKLVAAAAPSQPGASGLPRIILGAYAPRSHFVIDLAGCKVNSKVLQQVAGTLSRKWSEAGLSVYDEASGRGALRYVLLREVRSGAVQVSLVVAELPPRPPLQAVVSALAAAHPQLASVVLHHNPHGGNALLATAAAPAEGTAARRSGASLDAAEADAELGTGDEALLGPDFLYEELGEPAAPWTSGLRVRVSARSFLQVNRAVASRIYADVAAALPAAAGETILDLYCGVGALGRTVLAASPQARLIGIESSASAVADAEHSARLAGLPEEKARFLCGAVEALLPGLFPGRSAAALPGSAQARAARPPLLVLLNPPRRGCTPAVLAELIACAPRAIAYVSCSPQSLARDLHALLAAGYELRQVTPYDMHPGTPHVETVALLARRSGTTTA